MCSDVTVGCGVSTHRRLANALVGNKEDAAALEFSLSGPTLKFHTNCLVSLTGAQFATTLDGEQASLWPVAKC
jgi:urea carboxylase